MNTEQLELAVLSLGLCCSTRYESMQDGGKLCYLEFSDRTKAEHAWYFLSQSWTCQLVIHPQLNLHSVVVRVGRDSGNWLSGVTIVERSFP